MLSDLKKLIKRRNEIVGRANKAMSNYGVADDDEELGEELRSINRKIKQYEDPKARETRTNATVEVRKPVDRTPVNPFPYTYRATPNDAGDLNGISQFFALIKNDPHDERVARFKHIDPYETRELTSSEYSIPQQFKAELLAVASQKGIMRQLATVIPPGSPPDAKLTMPAIDQTPSKNLYGGITIVHTGEAANIQETDATLRQLSLESKEMTTYIVVSDKLLSNWVVADKVIKTLLLSAMAGQEDYDFMRGNGVNRATGFIDSAAALAHTRTTPGTIVLDDLLKMISKSMARTPKAWIASGTCIPQLAQLVDNPTNRKSIWLGGRSDEMAAKGLPAELLGFPIYFSERAPALGSRGDISLVEIGSYLVKEGSGPFVAVSSHVPGLFQQNKTAFKIRANVDGRPMNTEPFLLEGLAGYVSPFVVLQ